MKFSYLPHVKGYPTTYDATWDTLAEQLTRHDFRTSKDGPLFSPAEFDGTGKEKSNVLAVHFAVLDLDGEKVPGPEGKPVHGGVELGIFTRLLAHASKYDALAYATWSQPFAASRGATCSRLVLPFSRPVQPSEWPTVRARLVVEFGCTSDGATNDPNRCYFTPALPAGNEAQALTWRALDGWQGGARAWDVDAALLAGPPATTSTALAIYDARDPIPRDAVMRLATKLSKSDTMKRLRAGQLMRAGLDGHDMAAHGDRHAALRDVAFALAVAYPTGSPESLAGHFRQSIDLMRAAGTNEDPQEHFVGLVESAQRKVQENEQAKQAAETNETARKIGLVFGGSAGEVRYHPYTPEELAAWEADEPLASRWIIQVGSQIWLFVGGSYKGPFSREAIPSACAQYLAPAISAGVVTHKVDDQGNRKHKDLADLVGTYGRVCMKVEGDMCAQRAFLDSPRETIVEAPCPLRRLEPAFDTEVDEWLRLLAGKKYPRLRDWIATCTWLRECAPAVFLKGASGAGKNLFASGLARLWTVSDWTDLSDAMGPFNASITACPLVYGDEEIPKTWRSEPRTEELRALITKRVFKINEKNKPLVTCYGSARVVIGANRFDVISAKTDPTPEDSQALADRFILIDVGTIEHCPARDWLIAHGGGKWGESAVNGDRIAKHALWLRDEVESGARVLTRGGRMVVPGDASELLSALRTSSKGPGDALLWLWSFLQDQPRHVAGSTGRPFAAMTSQGKLLVSVKHMIDAWDHYLPGEKPPGLGALKNTFRGLVVPTRNERIRRGPSGRQTGYQEILITQLTEWAAAQGEDVSNVAELLAVETELLGTGPVPGQRAN